MEVNPDVAVPVCLLEIPENFRPRRDDNLTVPLIVVFNSRNHGRLDRRADGGLQSRHKAAAIREENGGSSFQKGWLRHHGCWPNHVSGSAGIVTDKDQRGFLEGVSFVMSWHWRLRRGRDARDHRRRLRTGVAGSRLPICLQSWIHGRDTGEGISGFRLGVNAQSPGGLYVVGAELIAVRILIARVRIQQRRH